MSITVGYSQKANQGRGGWTSFYSFIPEYMIGMNNRFYTFDKGNLYEHDSNQSRNTFYGVTYSSRITGVLNQSVLDEKLFKTLNLDSNDAWDASLETDLQTFGFIDKEYFLLKEGSYFAYIRFQGQTPAGVDEYALRSMNGIGSSTSYTGGATATATFALSVNIGSVISVGDAIYFFSPPSDEPLFAGYVSAINVDIGSGTNEIEIDTSDPSAVPVPVQDAFFMYLKNMTAESKGLLGSYLEYTIENDSTDYVEIFGIQANLMKSFP